MLLEGCHLCDTWGFLCQKRENHAGVELLENHPQPLFYVSLLAWLLTTVLAVRSTRNYQEGQLWHLKLKLLYMNLLLVIPLKDTTWSNQHIRCKHTNCGHKAQKSTMFWICRQLQASMTDHANRRPFSWANKNLSRPDISPWMPPLFGHFNN